MWEMKGQVLPEELQCLGTERDCGCGVNMDDRTVKIETNHAEPTQRSGLSQ